MNIKWAIKTSNGSTIERVYLDPDTHKIIIGNNLEPGDWHCFDDWHEAWLGLRNIAERDFLRAREKLNESIVRLNAINRLTHPGN